MLSARVGGLGAARVGDGVTRQDLEREFPRDRRRADRAVQRAVLIVWINVALFCVLFWAGILALLVWRFF